MMHRVHKYCSWLPAQIAEAHKDELKSRIGTSESRMKNVIKSAAKPVPEINQLESMKVAF
jgi:hypothetical protein